MRKPVGFWPEESRYEFGIATSTKTWDRDGKQTMDFELTESHPNYQSLLNMRAMAAEMEQEG
jgi:hypothetical protein